MLGPVDNLGTVQQEPQLPVTSPRVQGIRKLNRNSSSLHTVSNLSPMGSMVSPSTVTRLRLLHTDNHSNNSPLRLLLHHTANHRLGNTVSRSHHRRINMGNSLQQVLTASNQRGSTTASNRHLTNTDNSNFLPLLMDNRQ